MTNNIIQYMAATALFLIALGFFIGFIAFFFSFMTEEQMQNEISKFYQQGEISKDHKRV